MAQRVYVLRAEVVVIVALLGLAGLAWLFTDLEMVGMDAGPGTDPGAFGFYITTWVVMMAAMMFPSLAPMVVVLRRLERRLPASSLTTPLFVIGYLAVWTASGLVAYGVLKAGRPGGAFSMGIRHGAWCLGCCWALMVALFALGAMSLTWMAVLAALIAAEKLLPWRRIAIAAVAAALLALAVGVAAAPADVPGLTVPGGMSSASAMKMMR
jgi:predicted metal-binding membrane protein